MISSRNQINHNLSVLLTEDGKYKFFWKLTLIIFVLKAFYGSKVEIFIKNVLCGIMHDQRFSDKNIV